jgi:hypothetical protein
MIQSQGLLTKQFSTFNCQAHKRPRKTEEVTPLENQKTNHESNMKF